MTAPADGSPRLSVIGWFRRRTISRYADDKAVDGFARVAREQSAPLDYDQDKRIAELLSDDADPAVNFDEIAQLLGQSERNPKL